MTWEIQIFDACHGPGVWAKSDVNAAVSLETPAAALRRLQGRGSRQKKYRVISKEASRPVWEGLRGEITEEVILSFDCLANIQKGVSKTWQIQCWHYRGGRWGESINFLDTYRTPQDASEAILAGRNAVDWYRVTTVTDPDRNVYFVRPGRQGSVYAPPAEYDKKYVYHCTPINLTTNERIDMNNELAKPINLDRVKVIDRLNELNAEAQAERDAEEAKFAAKRQEVLDAIAAFTPMELYRIFANNFTTSLEDLKEYKKEGTFDLEDPPRPKVETDRERFIRVLEMSPDATVEVAPTDDLYRQL